MRLALASAAALCAGCSFIVPGSGAYEFGQADAGIDAGMDSGARPDAELDAGVDSGERPDAAPDAADGGPRCEPPCSGETPLCRADLSCVACLGDGDCGPEAPRCEPAAGACVECLDDAHCSDPSAARCDAGQCVPCAESAQCTGIAGLGVCDAGRCVECTDLDAAACPGELCRADRTCSAYPLRTLDACQACDTDLNCRVGQLCVELTYADPPPERVVGTFCQWRRDARPGGAGSVCGDSTGPFALERELTSVDGVTANLCTLATTTCPALLHHAIALPGCDAPGTGDDACGASGFADGRCRYANIADSTDPRCTYPCVQWDDCPSGAPCGDGTCSPRRGGP